jgi:hypothetical protein
MQIGLIACDHGGCQQECEKIVSVAAKVNDHDSALNQVIRSSAEPRTAYPGSLALIEPYTDEKFP